MKQKSQETNNLENAGPRFSGKRLPDFMCCRDDTARSSGTDAETVTGYKHNELKGAATCEFFDVATRKPPSDRRRHIGRKSVQWSTKEMLEIPNGTMTVTRT